jgi:hypothetical protein
MYALAGNRGVQLSAQILRNQLSGNIILRLRSYAAKKTEVWLCAFIEPVYFPAAHLHASVLIMSVNQSEGSCNGLCHHGVKACRKDSINLLKPSGNFTYDQV